MIAFLVAVALSSSAPIGSLADVSPDGATAISAPARTAAESLLESGAPRPAGHPTRLLARTRFDGLRRRGERLRLPGGETGRSVAVTCRPTPPSPWRAALRAGSAGPRRAFASEARGGGGEEPDPDLAPGGLELARGAPLPPSLPDLSCELA